MADQFILSNPPSDAISSLRFSSQINSSKLLVASWDKNVYLHEIPESDPVATFTHQAPVLDACFGKDDTEIFTAGLNHEVRRIDANTSESTVLSTHAAGVKSVVYDPNRKLLISASWDSTLHIHGETTTTISLPSKPFSISLSASKLVVAMASRALHIYDLDSLSEPWQRRESSLKFMTRAVACMPNDAGYASSSIEGRVAVEWFDPSEESQSRKYAFKCHRQTVDGVDVVYPVNALAFHPIHGTFASGGGDGVVALWDGIGKRRIRQYQKYASSIAALSFSSNGKYLAIGISPGFEDGKDDLIEGSIKVHIRELGDSEAKAKSK